jgi:hypothetical protein
VKQHLDGDLPIEAIIVGQEYSPPTALTQPRQQPVPTLELMTDGKSIMVVGRSRLNRSDITGSVRTAKR